MKRAASNLSLIITATTTVLALALTGCSRPVSGPDKTAGGMLLGAGWGAGTGAIIGHQLEGSPTGEGAAVGAGVGLVAGVIGGGAYDLTEGQMLEQERTLASLKVRNMATGRQLSNLQAKLDRAVTADATGGVFQVFFDTDGTSMRAGSVANLEVVAESIKKSPAARKVFVAGHADDSGNPEYNAKVAEARARTVAAYLMSRGISSDQIVVTAFGSTRPLVTNSTTEGRQLNRRVDLYIGQ